MKKRSDLEAKVICLMIIISAAPATISLTELSTISSSTVLAHNESSTWKSTFDLEGCDFTTIGANTYFILEPGYKLALESQEGEENGELQLVITVLNETKIVNGTETRVVEERETENGELVEVSRNHFAVCKPSNDIYYFGEEVDNYEDGEIASHEGAWQAGIDAARAGIIMPGKLQVGFKHYQEIAPGIAEDRAEIVSLNNTLYTQAGEFVNVLKTEETNPLNPDEREFKYYAPEIGLIQDEALQLVNYTLSNE